MNPQLIMGTVMTFLHDLFTAVWIGGLFVLLFSTLPGLKKAGLDMKVTQKTALLIQKRMQPFVIASIIGIILTGILLSRSSGQVNGFFSFSSRYTTVLSIKHIFSILMILLAATRTVVLNKSKNAQSKKLGKISAACLVANLTSGIIVLFLSAQLSVMP
ncbi:MAG: hypothetical protein K8R40_00695 [Anaerolineaceae bacterium]|nr:hypothetical protein [Anaerolineaceae bacterium]